MHICLFEDRFLGNLLPLNYFRPVFDLRCGILTLRERILGYLHPSSFSLAVRDYLADLTREDCPGIEVNSVTASECLFVNSRVIFTGKLAKELRKAKGDLLFTCGDVVVAARLSGDNLLRVSPGGQAASVDFSSLHSVTRADIEATLVSYPWDLIYANESEIVNDFLLLTKGGKRVQKSGKIHASAVLLGKKHIHVGRKSEIGPGAVLDATAGPIYIGERVKVLPNAVLEGPCSVGAGSVIRVGAKIYAHTSIGPVSKVGGEVEHSIFHSHANKQHDGYLGHSYVCPWVNLGAGTTTSNLKNTYGNVKVHIDGRLVDTGRMFVGLMAGDHVKTGINGTLDTGTVIGPSSNIFGTAIPRKDIPAFSWGDAGGLQIYEFEKALDVAERVMARRNVKVTEAYRKVFHAIFSMTTHDRAVQSV